MRSVRRIFLLGVVAQSQPISYPISVQSLIKCNTTHLCRPPRSYNKEELAYIRKLRIVDPAFYDVFTRDEIFKWFKPAKMRQRIPFYIWTNVTNMREAAFETPAWFQDVWATFYNDALQSTWRTNDSKSAVMHFFGGPVRSKDADLLPKPSNHEAAKEYVLKTAEFAFANGTNFFYVSSGWQAVYVAVLESRRTFEAMLKNETMTPKEHVQHYMTAMHYSTFPSLVPCTMTTHYATSDGFRSLRAWPDGPLPSYQYPRGAWQQMIDTRKVKWAFVGQADGREAYRERRQLLNHNVSALCKDGAILCRHGNGPDEVPLCPRQLLPDGGVPANLCQCYLPSDVIGVSFEASLVEALYAFHIRGDDYYSARIADILGAGAIPVIVDHTMLFGMSGSCQVPVKELAVWVPRSEWLDDPAKAALKAVSQKSHTDMEKMVRLLQYYRPFLLNGLYSDSRVVEDRIYHMATRCLTAELLRQFDVSKAELVCDFEDCDAYPAFPTIGDTDDPEVLWSAWL
eukprot:Blabericola_migrator_1__3025@NODE_187_length_11743_cov_250_942275_g162_i0_p5_GENE_NODE_187_length_11743_cov_250_942275_g162_i0NODE_187_length_11743_cov_250_942275_g162_i0_p5_ORF_typecomplete_len512_score64_89Exostosin/PF03016_15/4_4e10_NODE_187_length_11743_cov_250_942275_g162_i074268961